MEEETFNLLVVLIVGCLILFLITIITIIYRIWKCFCQTNDGHEYLVNTSTGSSRTALEYGIRVRERVHSHVVTPSVYSNENERRPAYVTPASQRIPNRRDYDRFPIPTGLATEPPPLLPVRLSQPKKSRALEPKNFQKKKAACAGPVARHVIRNKVPGVSKKSRKVSQNIASIQGGLRRNQDIENGKLIEEAQNMLLELGVLDQTLISEDCRLVIGVDATPVSLAGYCINLQEKSLRYYIIHRNHLPWQLHDLRDTSEFEMKNFIFALTVWADEIVKWKRIRIYTDNFAITKSKEYDKNHYGDRAFQVLSHFEHCKGVVVLNKQNMAVNKFKDLEVFAKYLRPADDLSRFNIDEAVQFLSKMYSVQKENVEGTHCKDKNRPLKDGKPWFHANDRYWKYCNIVQTNILDDCSNQACSLSDLLQASLRSTT